MTRIYIDEQTTRNRWRLRIMAEGKETYASYFESKNEAHKARKLLRKALSSLTRG